MSLSFDGVNDSITSGTITNGNTLSMAAWMKATSQGGSDRGTLMFHGARTLVSWNDTTGSKKLQVFTDYSGANGSWDMTTAFSDITVWIFVGLVFSSVNVTTSDPILYTLVGDTFTELSVGSGLTETSTPTGNLAADNVAFGNGIVSGSDAFAGLIGETALWPIALTANEMAGVAVNGLLSVPGAAVYWSLDGPTGTQDLSGNARTGTISGATVDQANPPTRPAGRRG